MSQNQSTARTPHTRKARLKALAARPALIALAAAGVIAGSTGLAAAASSPAHLAAHTASAEQPCSPYPACLIRKA